MDSLVRQFLMGSSSSRLTDPYFEYTTLLLPGNGTNGAQNNTFLDSSSNNFTITRNGNTTQGTFSPFSPAGWSAYFDGTGDYLSIARNLVLLPGANVDFTIEAWVYPLRVNVNQMLMGFAESQTNSDWIFSITSSGGLNVFSNYFLSQGWYPNSATGIVIANQWNHIMLSRTGSTLSIGANGVASTYTFSLALGQNGGGSYQFSIAADQNGDEDNLQGYISDLRIVTGSGTGLYNGTSYTVPTTPLTAITGTQLLTCNTNRFIDLSSNNLTITRNGDTRVVPFSPFNPTAVYNPVIHGGSAYFDGSGDYLTSPSSSAYLPSTTTTPFTLECWVYNTGTSTTTLYSALALVNYGFVLGFGSATGTYDSTATPWFGYFSGSWSGIRSTVSIPINAWTHIACVFTGSTCLIFQDGVQTASGGPSTWPSFAASVLRIGCRPDAINTFTGYISNVRIVVGTAVYTSAFTPPTAPVTATTNTSLLLNFTNAGIYDATSKNDLETVGDAQISNTTAKWGSTSIKFDGTGDYLQAPYQTLSADFGTGQFTIELWVYFSSSVSTTQMFVSSNYNAGTGAGGWAFLRRGDNNTIVFTHGSNVAYGKTWSPSLNIWYHCAVTRDSSNNLRIFVNGTQVGSTDASVTASINGATSLLIGTNQISPFPLTGYLQDLRITRGYARYTSNFTPPTAAFPTL